MTPKIRLITASVGAVVVLGVPTAWGQTGPDAFERAVTAREQSQRIGLVASYPDAFERAVLSSQQSAVGSYADAHGRGVAGDRRGVTVMSRYPDAFERALGGRPFVTVAAGSQVLDSHNRMTPTSTPTVAPVSSGSEVEWPQIGIGFGAGILLALLLGSALRVARIRPLAH